MTVVVVDDRVERGESTVVVEAALVNFLCVEQGTQRSGDVAPLRAAVSLEAVDPDFSGCVEVLAGLGEDRGYVAGCALRRTVEDRLPAFECSLVV